MNIVASGKKHQGSVLLVALLTAWVIGIALVSYLTLIANQNRSTYRSLSWNTCIPVLEAGIEEALTQIHYAGNTANFGANQWTYNATDGRHHKTRTLTNSEGSYYDVSIQPTDPRGEPHGPVIFSTGYVPAPADTGAPLGGESAFGMILSAASVSLQPTRFVSRTVRVTTVRPYDGIKSKGVIAFSGGSYFDSFDSSNVNYSGPGGRYDPAKRRANARALTNLKTANAINVGGGTVFGSVTTGPGGVVTIGDGTVGDLAWNANNSGIQPGHRTDDANMQFNDVQPPFVYGSGLTPVSGLGLDGLLYTWILGSGNYQMGSVNISGGRIMLVTGNATLYVNGNFSTSGTGGVIIAPGASLKLYVAGSTSVSGNGIVNNSGRARNLSIYGLNTSTAFAYTGTSEFIGTVYAPHAAIKFSGGAAAYGAFTGDNVIFSGGAHVAYDEDIKGDYVMDSWNEI